MAETKKGCELCRNPARMFCDSDQASLCWDCDQKVHSANFLVAKHSRTLLCDACQSPTPWSASGPNLGRSVSVCQACAHRGAASTSPQGNEDDDDSQESESDDGEYYSESNDFSEEEDGENQVVPWSASDFGSPPRPAAMTASSSSSGDNASFSSSKRTRENPSETEDEYGGCSSSDLNSDENCSYSTSLLRPPKTRRIIPAEEEGRDFSGTAAIVEKLRRFERL